VGGHIIAFGVPNPAGLGQASYNKRQPPLFCCWLKKYRIITNIAGDKLSNFSIDF